MLVPLGGAELGGIERSEDPDSVEYPELLLGSESDFPSEVQPKLEDEGGSEESEFPGASACGTSEVDREL